MPKNITAEEAVKVIKSGDRVFVHSVAAAPQILTEAMTARAHELEKVEVVHLHTEGNAPYVQHENADTFRLHSLFVGENVRKATQEGRADYIPVFLSETPGLFRKNVLPLDVALVQISPPDRFGYCSLGTSVDASKAAVEMAKVVIAQVNPKMPRTYGDALMHVRNFDILVDHECPLHEVPPAPPTDIEKQIGYHVASLIEDGATLQMGIGAIPNAVLSHLDNHKNLGIHTEMFSDGLIPLVEKGVVTGSEKTVYPNRIVSTFVMGTNKTYDFINENPQVLMMEVNFVNDVSIIRKNHKMTAINSAIEIDITGQVCSDSIGTKHYSGVGGQIDFIRGASYVDGGKPIIAMPSVTSKGVSKIVPYLKQGAGVVTTRANVHYIVTEYGVVDLYGKSLRQRAELLISIAHPDHREALEKAVFERFGKL
ncbi:acetyl-CoA hydrolase/transferase C-terminal domain-containing protein [Cytophagaceae bacterium ABcell3]|nr:acetyl-CoA hydrolase/transferase C-terminal domain-containing protein [Cytophagaceae bacterium ABcell3]